MKKATRYTATVLSHRQLSSHGYELVLSREGLEFQAGRLVTLHGRDITEDRSYSIASGVDDDFITILYRLIPSGTLTPQLHALNEGDSLDMSGPFGQFIVRDPNRPLVFVATGTGVAPYRSYIRSHSSLNASLIMGVRHEEDLYFREEFETRPFYPCLSQKKDNHDPARVTEILQDWKDDKTSHYYLCGAFTMIFDVHALLRQKGIEDDRIFTEEYYY